MRKLAYRFTLLLLAILFWTPAIYAQEQVNNVAQEGTAQTSQAETTDGLSDDDTVQQVQDKVSEIGDTINQSETAKDIADSILAPIYQFAEMIAHPAFYWIAFALMVTGVVSYLCQLVLSKFFLLFKMSLDIKEILADLLGLIISLVGLVLTTQAATENSSFTESPVLVLSATIVGVIFGFVFYVWGQRQEFDAAKGTRKSSQPKE